MSKRSKNPVSSYSPHLMALLVKGSSERVEVKCPDQRYMQFLQARLHSLRAAMRDERHPQYGLVSRARTTRTWDHNAGPNTNCRLIIQPNDAVFTSAIKAAGVDVKDFELDVVDAPPIDFDLPDPYARFKDK